AQVWPGPAVAERRPALPGHPDTDAFRPGVPRPAVQQEPAATGLRAAGKQRLAGRPRLDLHRKRGLAIEPRPARQLAAAPGKEGRQRPLRAMGAQRLIRLTVTITCCARA